MDAQSPSFAGLNFRHRDRQIGLKTSTATYVG